MNRNFRTFSDLSLKQKFDVCFANPNLQYRLENYLSNKTTLGILITPNDIRDENADAFEYYRQTNTITRWKCSDQTHYPSNDEIITYNDAKNGLFAQVLKFSPNLECLDFRGLAFDNNHVELLNEIPNTIRCCHFDLNEITAYNFKRVVDRIGPTLQHLSVGSHLKITENDDNPIDPLEELLSVATNLTNCSIVFYNNNQLPIEGVRYLSPTVRELAIYDKDTDLSRGKLLAKYVSQLNFNELRQLSFTTKTGNCKYSLSYLKKIVEKNRENLHIMRLDVMNLANQSSYWKIIRQLSSLQDLSINFYGLKAQPKFSEHDIPFLSLRVLNLENLILDSRGIESINRAFPNLMTLKLHNCLFTDGQLIDVLEYMPNFETLFNFHITYSLPENPIFNFPNAAIDSLHYMLDRCDALQTLVLLNWPQLHEYELIDCYELAKQKGIEIVFRPN